MEDDPTMQRLTDEIIWYDRRAKNHQYVYKIGKLIVITSAALIPFISALPGVRAWYTGALGVLIAVVEGVQQLNQHHANWASYRSTCEALKHEKYLYLAQAGPYAAAENPHGLLAERVESLVSQETAKWASLQENASKKEQAASQKR